MSEKIRGEIGVPGKRLGGGSGEIGRRRFLALACCGCACGAGRVSRILASEAKPVDVGVPSDFPKDGISDRFTGENFFVIRRDGRLYATTSICSHMGEPLLRDSQDDTRIKCSGHESVFDNEGRVLVGPATQGLARLGIALNAEGHIIVDPAQSFPEIKWEEKGSFLELK
ncbi:MAG TPA: Rieske (2Fe-2S) protein [Verrucomicrobiae bacterium]|nr:Rieske (2Fe-2S) protein [Verrucomicrobiae bacterium]